jgi:hypothetical protein
MDLAGVGREDNWIREHWALSVGEDSGVGRSAVKVGERERRRRPRRQPWPHVEVAQGVGNSEE